MDIESYRLENVLNNKSNNIICRKYLSLDKFLDMLINKHICFPRCDQFEDQSESCMSVQLMIKLLNHAMRIADLGKDEEFYNQFNEIMTLPPNHKSLPRFLKLIEHIMSKENFPESTKKEVLNEIDTIKYARLKHYAYCFSKNSEEQYLLWKTYTDDGKGLSFSFNNFDLINQFKDNMNLMHISFYNGLIKYNLNENDSAEALPFYKHSYYKGEEEMRLVIKLGNPQNYEKPFINLVFDASIIKDITLSPFLSNWQIDVYRKTIITVWEKVFPNVEVPKIAVSQVGKKPIHMI